MCTFINIVEVEKIANIHVCFLITKVVYDQQWI